VRREFALPDVGEGLTEADILTWHVAPGDPVAVNQILVEIETAKAAVELPSPWAGTVGELLAGPGDTVAVGSPIIAIETAEAGTAPATSPVAAAAPAEERGAKIGEAGADGRIATLVGYGPRPGSVTRRPRRRPAAAAPAAPAAPAAATPVATTPMSGAPASAEFGTSPDLQDRNWTGVEVDGVGPGPGAAAAAPGGDLVPLAKPPVRKLARDLGVDLRAVTGTGAGGVITREDVQAFAGHATQPAASQPAASQPPAAQAAGGGGVRREPIRGVRKATAAAMVASAFTAPHVTEFLAVDVTATMELRARLRATRGYADVPLTPLAFVAKAVCLAARRTPEVNAHWDEAAGEIVYYDRVQLGIAAATPRGLIVPKIRDADTLSLRELAVALGALTATARSGRTPPSDLVGGTFTITNVGVFGVDTGTPILNPGEAAILAVGAIKPAPWVVDGELAVRTVGQLALSFDHRLIDGAQGSRFLADVGALLADPGLALTW
jgi:2-oxoisovalerate dehydrogenase E2 component (dihydrolipoyl transacylase)